MASSIMKDLPHDIIRQIILLSTREERLRKTGRKNALDYWTRVWEDHRARWFSQDDRAQNVSDVHNQMKRVTRLERDACHRSALPLPGSTQADEGPGIMWRRVWWSRKSMTAAEAFAFFPNSPPCPLDEWALRVRRQKEEAAAAIHYDPTGEFLLAQHD